MTRLKRQGSLWLVCVSCFLPACVQHGSQPVELELRARGSAETTFDLVDGTRVNLTRADLAFGPLTLCPGPQAGELCDTARLEWLDAAVIDLLEPKAQRLGTIAGLTGFTRSVMYDFGFVSLLTQDELWQSDAALALADNSLLAEGVAVFSGRPDRPFVIAIPVAAPSGLEPGQPVVRRALAPSEVEDVTLATTRLEVDFSAITWLSGLSARTFWESGGCPAEFPSGIHCEDEVAVDCESLEKVDCAGKGQICQPERGCTDVTLLDLDTRAGAAVRQSLLIAYSPTLEFR